MRACFWRELGDSWVIALALNNLGYEMCRLGDYDRAAALCEESVALHRTLGDHWGVAHSLHSLGRVLFFQGHHARARELYSESIMLHQQVGDRGGVAECLEAIAELGISQGAMNYAAQFYGTAVALRDSIRMPLPSAEQAQYERNVATARQALGGSAWTAAWAAGRALTMEEAIAAALGQARASEG